MLGVGSAWARFYLARGRAIGSKAAVKLLPHQLEDSEAQLSRFNQMQERSASD